MVANLWKTGSIWTHNRQSDREGEAPADPLMRTSVFALLDKPAVAHVDFFWIARNGNLPDSWTENSSVGAAY